MKITLKALACSGFIAALLPTLARAAEVTPTPVAVHPLNMFLGLLFLAIIVVGGWWLVRRAGGLQIKPGNGMRIIAALSVGARERVVLIEIAGEQLLLGVAPGQVTLLQRFEQPVIAASSDDFASKVRQIMQQGLGK
ncbi:MAG TPA: flagellar biosynthetic protein FliO [Spongiibacteraceae bacterium]|nr:flagellar biosynthetic protein FliO [Spongiibacteraceae bacterium]